METPYDKVELFKNNLSSFKETSKDTDSGNVVYMTQSEVQVVNFDKVKEKYIKGMKLKGTPCSIDALYISETGEYSFVEFKNGVMKAEKIYNVYNKIYDSLLIFNDIIQTNISFCRENVNFILVYNGSKNPEEGTSESNDSSRVKIAKHFTNKAGKHFVRYNMDKYKKIYFKDVFTYTEEEFENQFLAKI